MAATNKKKTVQELPELLSYWDFERNEKIGLNPATTTVNSEKMAFWKCENGHTWQETVKVMKCRKNKCFICKGREILPGENDLQTLYPELAEEWDSSANGITPDKISPRDTKKYWWKCKHGHPSFERSVTHRVTRKDVCPYCSGEKVAQGFNDLLSQHPDIAAEWDYEANKGVLPQDVYENTWKSFGWICPKGHHYRKKVYLRTHPTHSVACPKCAQARSTSFPEQALYFYTKQCFPDAINRYKGWSDTGLELDIYIPSWKTGIEYDGARYHASEVAKDRERRKFDECRKRGIMLIRVREGRLDGIFDTCADETFAIKKRPSDEDMNMFLFAFFGRLTLFSHPHLFVTEDPNTKQRQFSYKLPADINIQRDRPIILEYLIDTDRSFGALYPELAKYWDQERNGNLTPLMLTPGSNHSAFFKCSTCGNSWSAPIYTIVKWKRTQCKKCSMSLVGKEKTKYLAKKRGSLGDRCPEAVRFWDFEKNGDLSPYTIALNYSKKVAWKCPKCGYEWKQSPNGRIRKGEFVKCPHCAGKVPLPGVDDLATLYPDIAKEWDFDKNGNVIPSQLRPHSNELRYWICSKHLIPYRTSPSNRINHEGCPLCKREKVQKSKGFRVEQYDSDHHYIRTFPSTSEASRTVGMSSGSIGYAARNGSMSGGYYWKFEGKDFGIPREKRVRPIVATSQTTGEITEFESAQEAERRTGVGKKTILKCCKASNSGKASGGFVWRYK